MSTEITTRPAVVAVSAQPAGPGLSDAFAMLLSEIEALRADLRGTSTAAPGRLLSKRQAAKMLGISRGRTLETLIEQGRVRTVRVGARVKIPAAEVERLAVDGFDEAPVRRSGSSAGRKAQKASEVLGALRAKGF